jgi:hypothetical protein
MDRPILSHSAELFRRARARAASEIVRSASAGRAGTHDMDSLNHPPVAALGIRSSRVLAGGDPAGLVSYLSGTSCSSNRGIVAGLRGCPT